MVWPSEAVYLKNYNKYYFKDLREKNSKMSKTKFLHINPCCYRMLKGEKTMTNTIKKFFIYPRKLTKDSAPQAKAQKINRLY